MAKTTPTESIPKEEYEELIFFKKLVENNLTEDIAAVELRLIEETRKEKSLSKKEFLSKAKKNSLKDLRKRQLSVQIKNTMIGRLF